MQEKYEDRKKDGRWPSAALSLGKPLRDGSALFVLSQHVTFQRTFLIFNILTSPITFIVTQLVVSMIIDLEACFATFFLSNFASNTFLDSLLDTFTHYFFIVAH